MCQFDDRLDVGLVGGSIRFVDYSGDCAAGGSVTWQHSRRSDRLFGMVMVYFMMARIQMCDGTTRQHNSSSGR